MVKAWIFLLLGSMSACTCSRPEAGERDGGNVASAEASVPVTVGASDPRYSAPIAAGRSASGDLYVAGLVAPAGAIEMTRLSPDADGGAWHLAWTKPVLTDVKWGPDAELAVDTLGPGLAVSWEGLHAGHAGHVVQLVTADGEVHGAAFAVGGSVCATKTELAWPEAEGNATRVMARGWDGPARVVARLGADREPKLACADTRIFATGDGDEDVTLVLPGAGSADPARTLRLIASGDFHAKDEERTHELYTWGDQLGVVRIGTSGSVARREVGAEMSSWMTSSRPLAEDDDVVAVDADAHATYVVWTHDEDDGCNDSGAAASSVHLRVIPRAAGEGPSDAAAGESDVVLAPTDCTRDVGPFWTEEVGGDLVVTWAERTSRVDKTSAPIAALSYRRMRGAQVIAAGRIAAAADAMQSAGCEGQHCYAATLARAPGTDVMAPEAARVLRYP